MTGKKFERLFRERRARRTDGGIPKGEGRLSSGTAWTIRRVSRAEAVALSQMSRHAVELYKSIARKISPTRFPPRAVAAPESIYNSRVTVRRVLYIASVTHRRYGKTITHFPVFFLSDRTKWNR